MTQLFMTLPGPLRATFPPPPSGCSVRVAQSKDAPTLATLLSERFTDPWTAERVNAELFNPPDVAACWVFIDESGAVKGTASERLLPEYGSRGYLHYVAVDASLSGRGVGRFLTEQVLAGFARRGLEGAVLETDDFRLPAVLVYLRLGFVPTYRSEAEILAWSALFPTLLASISKRSGK